MPAPRGSHVAEFEFYVLLAIARLGDGAYGVTIRQEIERRSLRPAAIGAIYATLARLEEKGLVRFHAGEARAIPGGRARKHVQLTRRGEAAIRVTSWRLGRMLDGLPSRLAPEKP